MFHFVANLKRYTFLDTRDEDRFDAYLLSADYASAHAELAAVVREQQRLLVADNGNMDAIRALVGEFAKPAAELDSMRKAWEKTAGHYARPSQLPRSLRRKFRDLAAEIVAQSEALTSDSYTRDAVQRQAAINPTMLVGMEDLAVGAMGALNIEPEYVDLPAEFFQARASRAVSFAQRTANGEFGDVSGKIFAGLHALDFDTAVLAGKMAASAGLDAITVGLFGALTDRNYVDYRVEDGEIFELPRSVPRPYLRVVEICAGLLEGFRRSGKPRPAFHALGVGTPILLPLLACA